MNKENEMDAVNLQTYFRQLDLEIASGDAITISNDHELSVLTERLRLLKSRAKEVQEKRLSLTRPLDDSKRRIMEMFAPYIDGLTKLESRFKTSILEYEERISEQRRLEQEEANRRAYEIEQKRKAELAEKARLAAESNNNALARTYAKQAEAVHVAPINVESAKRPGISSISAWKFEIIDPELVPTEYRAIDEMKIGRVVRALKGDCKIPGVKVWEEKGLSARAY